MLKISFKDNNFFSYLMPKFISLGLHIHYRVYSVMYTLWIHLTNNHYENHIVYAFA